MLIGCMRIKNEARWIERVIASIQPVCGAILVLDDHSTDGTDDICESMGCIVHRSHFTGLDESRDKDWLLNKLFEIVPKQHHGNAASPYWALTIDGDEELHRDDAVLVSALAKQQAVHAWSMQVMYLWDTEEQWRVDGCYGNFRRPSMFRLMNPAFRYLKTPYGNGANFHCSSVPQEMLHHSRSSDARLLHYGYLHKEDRIRKWHWYTKLDPDNKFEDGYRHVVQGDVPEIPADAVLRHGGPLTLRRI